MLKHFLQTFAFRIAMMVMSLTQGIIIARCLLPEGKGTIALFMTGFTLIFSLMNCGIRQSTAYSLGKENAAYEDLSKLHAVLLPFLYLICAGSIVGMYFYVGVADQIAILPFIAFHLFTMLYTRIANSSASS
jgi:O-antigen/teichoic acid export membrane protein